MVPRARGNLAKDPLGGLGDREAHIGADVEYHYFDLADVLLDVLEQLDHFLLASRITTKGVGDATLLANAID
jgi:hypothetical protein